MTCADSDTGNSLATKQDVAPKISGNGDLYYYLGETPKTKKPALRKIDKSGVVSTIADIEISGFWTNSDGSVFVMVQDKGTGGKIEYFHVKSDGEAVKKNLMPANSWGTLSPTGADVQIIPFGKETLIARWVATDWEPSVDISTKSSTMNHEIKVSSFKDGELVFDKTAVPRTTEADTRWRLEASNGLVNVGNEKLYVISSLSYLGQLKKAQAAGKPVDPPMISETPNTMQTPQAPPVPLEPPTMALNEADLQYFDIQQVYPTATEAPIQFKLDGALTHYAQADGNIFFASSAGGLSTVSLLSKQQVDLSGLSELKVKSMSVAGSQLIISGRIGLKTATFVVDTKSLRVVKKDSALEISQITPIK